MNLEAGKQLVDEASFRIHTCSIRLLASLNKVIRRHDHIYQWSDGHYPDVYAHISRLTVNQSTIQIHESESEPPRRTVLSLILPCTGRSLCSGAHLILRIVEEA